VGNLIFEDLPKAMETILKTTTILQQELENIKKNFQPKEPI
jgi:hypothetical protein